MPTIEYDVPAPFRTFKLLAVQHSRVSVFVVSDGVVEVCGGSVTLVCGGFCDGVPDGVSDGGVVVPSAGGVVVTVVPVSGAGVFG